MSLQITAVGLFTIVAFYAIAGYALAILERTIRPERWRWAIIAPVGVCVLGLPWFDEVWIAWHFGELCKDAGVHVSRKVEVPGYFDDTYDTHRGPLSSQGIDAYEKAGYSFYENKSRDKFVRREKINGQWQTTIHDQPTARYHFRKTRNDEDVGYRLEAIEYVVVDSHTKEVIARRAIYKRYPGWVNAIWARFLGSGMTMCPDPERGPRQPLFPAAALNPTRTK